MEYPHIVVIVQARMSSSRLPGKVLFPLLDKPLLVRMVERLQLAKTPFTTVVATSTDPSDDVIEQVCQAENISVYRGSLTDCLDRHYQIAERWNADVAVKIPSDCPLIDPRIIDETLQFFLNHADQYDFVSNLHPATWPDGNDVEIMTRACLRQTWAEATKPLEREHTTPYIWDTRPDRFRIGNVEWATGLDYSMSHRFTIDYPADYDFICTMYEELYPTNPDFSCEDILTVLHQKPEIYALNAHFAGVNWYRNHLEELNTVSTAQTRTPHPNQSTMTNETLNNLQQTALRVREHIIRLSTDGGCFTGASLSATDLVVYLYKQFLNISKETLNDPGRDYLFLSKGHDVPALYGTFVELGWMPAERLNNHLSSTDSIYWHPNVKVPGIEFHSGSLGHLPAVALGVALDCKISGAPNKVVCILGDGELNEGSVWEAVLVANAHQLDNLLFVVDRNFFQANMPTEELIPLEPLADKFIAFGAAVKRVDGHDFAALETALSSFPFEKNKLNVLIADTRRGKGLPSIEARADRWFCNFTHDEVDALLAELHGEEETVLASETLVVR